ncbi:winged helix-turn-helix transcriptional regulator [Sphingomonas lycopersici]|uniref:Winged helix-turn-helix transcriptional regulator n=1 Tax=Sphingomonas lycopersici TaxID=2951807 RepID=A0AA42CS61_9SPHN|nr:winged helix-turn-helix transcriptional regulator [Sphingomonas lycopersici]MCW6536897.1 winged helix-turn-helix transcriptional regulator [Sphingomonas lycopersici]
MSRSIDINDPQRIAEDILSAKWTLRVLNVLAQGPARFSGLRSAIPAVSSNMLAARLRDLCGFRLSRACIPI